MNLKSRLYPKRVINELFRNWTEVCTWARQVFVYAVPSINTPQPDVVSQSCVLRRLNGRWIITVSNIL